MKDFKRMMMVVVALVGVIAAAGLAAFAQGNGQISVKPGTLKVLPDIEARIEMFEDQACTKPIPAGANLSYSGGAPAAWVRFTLKNNVAVKTSEFTFKRVIERDGVKVFDPAAEKASLGPKEVKVFAAERVYFSGTSNTVEARMLADIGNFVQETNEANNAAKYTVKASVVH